MMYPLKFKTIYKEKIWGGQKIREKLGKDAGNLSNCGETWEISGVPGNVSTVANGEWTGKGLQELLETHRDQLVGKGVYQKYGNEFPLLVKFIDANQDLSIQVHPDDRLARQRHNSFGKTEMWYIAQADEGASLITGFSEPVDKETYVKKFEAGELTSILNREKVHAGNTFFIPAGRVHTIGKGCLLAEVQQSSDVTYRIYDFDRVDDKGNKRELHVEEALDAIDYQHYDNYRTEYSDKKNEVVNLVTCPYFTTNKIWFDQPLSRNFQDKDTFVIYLAIDGQLTLAYQQGSVEINKGEAVLVPAAIKNWSIKPKEESVILESYIE